MLPPKIQIQFIAVMPNFGRWRNGDRFRPILMEKRGKRLFLLANLLGIGDILRGTSPTLTKMWTVLERGIVVVPYRGIDIYQLVFPDRGKSDFWLSPPYTELYRLRFDMKRRSARRNLIRH